MLICFKSMSFIEQHSLRQFDDLTFTKKFKNRKHVGKNNELYILLNFVKSLFKQKP